jgi:hypothetical protein
VRIGFPGCARHAQGQGRTAGVGLQDEVRPHLRDVRAHGRVLPLALLGLAIGEEWPHFEGRGLRSFELVDEHDRGLVMEARDRARDATARDFPGQGGQGVEDERIRVLEPARMEGGAVVVGAELVTHAVAGDGLLDTREEDEAGIRRRGRGDEEPVAAAGIEPEDG